MDPNVSQQAYTSMMKFTIDGRPFLKDIHDLFAALIVQIPLSTHRYLFRNYNNTFSSEDAIQALGSLRFSHSVRSPDPNNPSRLLRTTTTTTFNMARDMAKALCQHFQNCRLMESAIDPQNRSFRDKGIWHLTPKGLCVLQDFCVRTEVDMTSMRKHFSHIEPIQLVRLERSPDDDQLLLGRQNVSLVFRVMMSSLPMEGESENGKETPNNASNITSTSSSSTTRAPSSASSSASSTTSSTPGSSPFSMSSQVSSNDSRVQLLGNYLLTLSKAHRQNVMKTIKNMRTVFSTQVCCDWLLDYTSVSSREESEILANEFLKCGWIEYQDSKQANNPLRASKSVILVVTEKGKQMMAEVDKSCEAAAAARAAAVQMNDRARSVRSRTTTDDDNKPTTLREILSQDPEAMVITSSTTTSSDEECVEPSTPPQPRPGGLKNQSRPPSAAMDQSAPAMDPKESNFARLKVILDDPQLRSLFKDFLRANFCEENLDFWIDYTTLRRKCRNQSPALPSQNQKDLLEDAYDIWSTYLKPGASCELNVEHSLRQEMARLVNSMVSVIPTYTPGQIKPTVVISTPSASQSLRMMLKWFDRVDDHISRLMASDSVPKFVKTKEYRKLQEAREKEQAATEKEGILYIPSGESDVSISA
ncbi:regulator of G protein signaling domain-containing protein [Radiomyces spectabilis]|uniref:regulator of G protein signaling domain-containing protein n=1 Tax=Radiomyces spectabilis TaxID=64574 RepID=UPI00221EBCA8|nr:regulator of G protein signaling domain-containing protein [Radiomyces spectabilis]KAI8391005.1 regulator of G protein signaling domain-containing protein [Radiomyces spectabilis]